MRDAKVIGSITSTIKHPCLSGKKLLLVQVMNAHGEPEGKPQIVVDFIGAGKGDRVLLSWDGIGSQEYHNNPTVPQRAWLCGIIDETDND